MSIIMYLYLSLMVIIWINESNFLFLLAFMFLSLIFLKFITASSNILTFLLTLEFLTLTSIMVMWAISGLLFIPSMAFFTVFTLAVCEACVGLSLLIKTTRFSGSSSLSL